MDFKDVLGQFCFHGKILLRGMLKSIYGTVVAGLAGLSAYGFVSIPSEGGYTAVCEFIVAAMTLGMAIWAMYAFGGRKQKRVRGKYAR